MVGLVLSPPAKVRIDEVTAFAGGDEAVAATHEENPEEEVEEENAEEMENALGLTRAQRIRVQRGFSPALT